MKLISGGAAGGIANVVLLPIDVVGTLVAHDLVNGSRKFNGFLDCVMQIANRDGIKGFYRGWEITVAGAFVYRFFQLKFHFQILKIPEMNPYKDNAGVLGDPSWHLEILHGIRRSFMGFVFGFVAKNITSIWQYPFDTLRTRMIFDSLYDEHLYASCLDCFINVIQKEGVQGLYKGLYVSFFEQAIVDPILHQAKVVAKKAFF